MLYYLPPRALTHTQQATVRDTALATHTQSRLIRHSSTYTAHPPQAPADSSRQQLVLPPHRLLHNVPLQSEAPLLAAIALDDEVRHVLRTRQTDPGPRRVPVRSPRACVVKLQSVPYTRRVRICHRRVQDGVEVGLLPASARVGLDVPALVGGETVEGALGQPMLDGYHYLSSLLSVDEVCAVLCRSLVRAPASRSVYDVL